MGYNTVVVLYNDFTSEIGNNGPLGDRIRRAMMAYSVRDRFPMEMNFGAGMVVSQAHADYSQVVVVGQNRGRPVEEVDDLDWYAADQMVKCLERNGYRVTKRRKLRLPSSTLEDRT